MTNPKEESFINFYCQSDETGKIMLGELVNIQKVIKIIRIRINIFKIGAELYQRRGILHLKREWNLKTSFKTVANKITVLEGFKSFLNFKD